MSSGKEIRAKIGSVKSTQKITRAMELVAASKMRTARDRMDEAKPYAQSARVMIGHVANSHSEYIHPYLQEREVKKVGYIIVSTDRGLCGGLNINLFKKALQSMQEWQEKDVKVDLCLLGAKAEAFFKNVGGNVVATKSHYGDKPTLEDLIGVTKVMQDAYDSGEIDRLFIISNEFVNTIVQKPVEMQLIPAEKQDKDEMDYHWDYIYEPDAQQLLDVLLKRYVESQVYQSVVENIACEQASRMMAMKSATDNAGELIDQLNLAYNKARQAAITQELAEIVSGAAAV